MKVYKLYKKQTVSTTMEKAWDFFSSPSNLKEITPDYMSFNIESDIEGVKMYPGQLICYTVKPVMRIPLRWVTEITHVEPNQFFVDEQRFGPYRMWHHEHHFKQTEKGIEMIDVVHYVLPFGIFGRIANSLFVKKQLDDIFEYRFKKVEALFG